MSDVSGVWRPPGFPIKTGPFKKHILLDRDGVINTYHHDAYVSNPEDFVFIPGTLDAIRQLTDSGYGVIVISNQAGVAKGFLDFPTLTKISEKMRREIESAHGQIIDVLYCTHGTSGACECRKPKPGLIMEAAQTHGIRLAETTLIGDNQTDLAAARAAGCRFTLVLTGKSKAEDVAAWPAKPDRISPDLASAIEHIYMERHPG